MHIADNILFTKNGRRRASPWILTTLAEMKAYYPVEGELRLLYFRKK